LIGIDKDEDAELDEVKIFLASKLGASSSSSSSPILGKRR
ncbi:hypothetical protein ADUPG1_014540, partial [Aduncisulcus paluster]